MKKGSSTHIIDINSDVLGRYGREFVRKYRENFLEYDGRHHALKVLALFNLGLAVLNLGFSILILNLIGR